jgi:hypothetical protein
MSTISKYVILLFVIWSFPPEANCKGPAPGYGLLTIHGVPWACNVSTSYATFGAMAESESDPQLSLAVADGDLLYMTDFEDLEFYYRYSKRDGSYLSITFDTLNANTVRLNGQLKSLELSGSEGSWNLFRQLTDPQIEQLSTLHITGSLSNQKLFFLQQHEGALKGSGLVLDGACDPGMLGELLSVCRPAWLISEAPVALTEPGKCMALSHIELLWLEADPDRNPDLFAHCSNLETLIISGWEPETGELLSLAGAGSLHTLTLAECGMTDFSCLEFPPSLRRLHVIDCENLTGIGEVQQLKGLKGISFTASAQIRDIARLATLSKLRWLGFPENISQEEFESLLTGLPKVEAVELIGCQDLESISPLKAMKKLRILLVDLPREKLEDLDALQGLDLLMLESDHFDSDPEWITQLRASLPDTRVVPGSGLCLGSGWILVLLPLVLLLRFFLPFRKSAPPY